MGELLHHLLHDSATMTPAAAALQHRGRVMTYADLSQAVEACAT